MNMDTVLLMSIQWNTTTLSILTHPYITINHKIKKNPTTLSDRIFSIWWRWRELNPRPPALRS